MQGKSIRYFVTGNTSQGRVDFLPSNFGSLDRKLYLGNYPSAWVHAWTQTLGEKLTAAGQDVEYLVDCLTGTLAGLIAPGTGAGFFNVPRGTCVLEAQDVKILLPPSAREEFAKQEAGLLKREDEALSRAAEHFQAALPIHDEWERLYISSLDFHKINSLTLSLLHDLLEGKSLPKNAVCRDRFLGGATATGSVDEIDALTAGLARRIFIKGRPGTGKSTLLKKLAAQAQEKGFDVEVYHCGFDPKSLDMVILRELSVCVFDSTSPHEYFPSRPGDEVLDVYQAAALRDVDGECAAELKEIGARYSGEIAAAREGLKEAAQAEQERAALLETAVPAEARQAAEAELLRLFGLAEYRK